MKISSYLLTMAVLISLATGVYAQDNGTNHAFAVLKDSSGNTSGLARFTEDGSGLVRVDVQVNGISPGLHGIHIHKTGNCSPTFASAGDHYNPLGKKHGLGNPVGAHAGDLPNLEVNDAGVGRLNTTTDLVTISAGPATLFDSDGSALVIHAGADDQVTDPAGNSGDRIACGVIEKGTLSVPF